MQSGDQQATGNSDGSETGRRVGLLSIWVLLGDLGRGTQKHNFDLDWELLESRGRFVIRSLGDVFLEDGKTKGRLHING